ncbi:MAG: MBL fold metallo-hydrolase [Candidatus Methylarchaceae archaeon HK02M1]|nr:MBL fold metallo-hydrolase [Candidatus Methylarchaceae archaeon HK02M1]
MESEYAFAMIREIIVLGSGGGRVVTMKQERRTGGLAFLLDDSIFIIDPGPGSIYHFNQLHLDPFLVKGVLLSHRHPDHYCDAEIYIEAVTRGGNVKQGLLIGSKSVLEPVDEMGYPAISTYHKNLPEVVVSMAPGETIVYDKIKITALKSFHTDLYAIGFRLDDDKRSISYFTDTEFKEEMIRGAESSDLLILSVLRPGNKRLRGHLCIDDAIKIVELLSPRMVLITHFGYKMIRAPPENEAKKITERTGIDTIAAIDGMKITLSKSFKSLDSYMNNR